MAERQVVLLGRHCDLPSGRVLRQAGAREAGAPAEVAASRKQDKYADRDSRYLFESVAVETLAVLYSSADSLLKETGSKISLNTGESREVSFLHQRISVLERRFNAILFFAVHSLRRLNIVLAIV